MPLPPQPPVEDEDRWPGERRLIPHCDSSVLHAPGECQFCDKCPDWQEYREVARINFTGHSDPDFAPCPSEFFRPGEVRDRWPGNVPAPAGEPVPSFWEPLTDQETYTVASAYRGAREPLQVGVGAEPLWLQRFKAWWRS